LLSLCCWSLGEGECSGTTCRNQLVYRNTHFQQVHLGNIGFLLLQLLKETLIISLHQLLVVLITRRRLLVHLPRTNRITLPHLRPITTKPTPTSKPTQTTISTRQRHTTMASSRHKTILHHPHKFRTAPITKAYLCLIPHIIRIIMPSKSRITIFIEEIFGGNSHSNSELYHIYIL
jgi:hypothetical protein